MAKVNATVFRVLSAIVVEGVGYKPNQLVSADPELMAALKKDGHVDDSKAAVDYCKKEGVKVVKHEPAPAEPEQKAQDEDDEGEIAE